MNLADAIRQAALNRVSSVPPAFAPTVVNDDAEAIASVAQEIAEPNVVPAPRPVMPTPSPAPVAPPTNSSSAAKSESPSRLPAAEPSEAESLSTTDEHPIPTNLVRLELQLSSEQLNSLLRAIMDGQHTILTAREAAHHLRIPAVAIEKMAETGEIPAMRIDGRWRFPKSALDEWMIGQTYRREDRHAA